MSHHHQDYHQQRRREVERQERRRKEAEKRRILHEERRKSSPPRNVGWDIQDLDPLSVVPKSADEFMAAKQKRKDPSPQLPKTDQELRTRNKRVDELIERRRREVFMIMEKIPSRRLHRVASFAQDAAAKTNRSGQPLDMPVLDRDEWDLPSPVPVPPSPLSPCASASSDSRSCDDSSPAAGDDAGHRFEQLVQVTCSDGNSFTQADLEKALERGQPTQVNRILGIFAKPATLTFIFLQRQQPSRPPQHVYHAAQPPQPKVITNPTCVFFPLC